MISPKFDCPPPPPPPRDIVLYFNCSPLPGEDRKFQGPDDFLNHCAQLISYGAGNFMPASAASGSRWKLANHLWFAYVHAAAWWIKTIQWRQQNWKKVIQQSAVHIRSNNVEQVSMLTFFQSYGILKTVCFNFYWFILPPSSLWPMGIKRTVDAVSPSSIVKIAKPFGHSYGYAHIYISLYFYYEWIYLCWCHFHVQHPISKDFPRSCPSTGLFQWWWWFLGPLDGLFLAGTRLLWSPNSIHCQHLGAHSANQCIDHESLGLLELLDVPLRLHPTWHQPSSGEGCLVRIWWFFNPRTAYWAFWIRSDLSKVRVRNEMFGHKRKPDYWQNLETCRGPNHFYEGRNGSSSLYL